jgi:hypothetical protein
MPSPLGSPLDLVNVWDEDEPRPSLALDDRQLAGTVIVRKFAGRYVRPWFDGGSTRTAGRVPPDVVPPLVLLGLLALPFAICSAVNAGDIPASRDLMLLNWPLSALP